MNAQPIKRIWEKELGFKDQNHKQEFRELLQQADLDNKGQDDFSDLEYRQIGFLYLIAAYQAEFEEYEGCKFYVEDLDDLSLDGPVYLLEIEQLGEATHEHELMLRVGMKLLQGKLMEIDEENLPVNLYQQLTQALKIVRKS